MPPLPSPLLHKYVEEREIRLAALVQGRNARKVYFQRILSPTLRFAEEREKRCRQSSSPEDWACTISQGIKGVIGAGKAQFTCKRKKRAGSAGVGEKVSVALPLTSKKLVTA